MKINVEVDVTPEEMRRFLGLPDVEPLQQEMLERVRDQIEKSADPKYLANLAYQMVAGGVQSVDAFQKTFFDMLSADRRKKKAKDD